MEYLKFYNGVSIPQVGFGVYQIPEYEDAKKAVLTALQTGYRLIDTAQSYGNEKAVGDAIRESGIARDEIFVTSKQAMDTGFFLRGCDQSGADLA